MESLTIKIEEKDRLHKFRALSELKNEAKGGYLNGVIKIPETNPDFELALYSSGNYLPHTHLLFITPYDRKSKTPKKELDVIPERDILILLKNAIAKVISISRQCTQCKTVFHNDWVKSVYFLLTSYF